MLIVEFMGLTLADLETL